MSSLHKKVSEVRKRQQMQWSWHCLAWGMVAGGIGGCFVAIGHWLLPDRVSLTPVPWLLGAGPLAGCLWSYVVPRKKRDAAVAIDRTCGLKDRVTTALRLLEQAESARAGSVRALQIEDAQEHLAAVDPVRVAPLAAPRPWRWGLLFSCCAAGVAVGMFLQTQRNLVAAAVKNEVVEAQADRISDHLEELKEFDAKDIDPEIESLLKDLAVKIAELKQPGVDPKEALAKLSEMESALQQKQEQLNHSNLEASLQQVGHALSLAEPFAAAGEALSKGDHEKAAEELAKLEKPELDRQTERAVTEKLDQARNQTPDGAARKLTDAIAQMSQGLSQGDRNKFSDGAKGLAGECQKQGRRKKLTDLLRKQCQSLSECKSECESECKSTADSNKKGGKNWGLGASGNQPGEKTSLLKTNPQMQITGQQSENGEVDVETTTSPEQRQEATRAYREKVEKYQQLNESALESEPIPLGQRQMIRRYFELIRTPDEN